jgi:hypothetical protein
MRNILAPCKTTPQCVQVQRVKEQLGAFSFQEYNLLELDAIKDGMIDTAILERWRRSTGPVAEHFAGTIILEIDNLCIVASMDLALR